MTRGKRRLERPFNDAELFGSHAPQKEGTTDIVRHQPRIQMPPGQTRYLAHHLGGRRAGTCSEVLDSGRFCVKPASRAKAMTEGSGPAAAVASASRGTSIIAVPKKAKPFSSRHPAARCHNQPRLSSTNGPPRL